MLFFRHRYILYIQRRLSRNICRICRSGVKFTSFSRLYIRSHTARRRRLGQSCCVRILLDSGRLRRS
nr:MAG TPA: hypothetical protein [Caudoviricetes sp.]